MPSAPVFVPKAALLTAWEWAGHGTPPSVLGSENLWLTDESKRHFEQAAFDILGDLRLAANGMLTPDFRAMLKVLANGVHRFTAWLGDIEADETGTILVAVSGNETVRLIRKEDKVRLDRAEPGRPAESLIEMLPPVPPARITPTMIPRARFSGRPAQEDSYDEVDPTAERAEDPLVWARNLMRARRTGLHQLYAHNEGRRSEPLTVVDIAGTGRVLTHVVTMRRGEEVVRFAPGTRENLAEALYGALRGQR